MTDNELLMLAHEAMQRGYAPYTGVKIGSALECNDGTVVTGCNVECGRGGAGISAEQAAIALAVKDGLTEFSRIALVPSEGEDYCMPCAAGREMISQFGSDTEVLCAKSNGSYVSYRISQLYPRK